MPLLMYRSIVVDVVDVNDVGVVPLFVFVLVLEEEDVLFGNVRSTFKFIS
jgi:hypothetical protein